MKTKSIAALIVLLSNAAFAESPAPAVHSLGCETERITATADFERLLTASKRYLAPWTATLSKSLGELKAGMHENSRAIAALHDAKTPDQQRHALLDAFGLNKSLPTGSPYARHILKYCTLHTETYEPLGATGIDTYCADKSTRSSGAALGRSLMVAPKFMRACLETGDLVIRPGVTAIESECATTSLDAATAAGPVARKLEVQVAGPAPSFIQTTFKFDLGDLDKARRDYLEAMIPANCSGKKAVVGSQASDSAIKNVVSSTAPASADQKNAKEASGEIGAN